MQEWNYENEQWTKLPLHLRHLPLFTRHLDWASIFIRWLWANFLKLVFFRFYIRLKVVGDFGDVYKKHPRLIVISNHASHLDAISIAAAIPFRYWLSLYIAAAKDYFFANYWMSFFSKHCIGAIPIDRKERKGESVRLCLDLLKRLHRIWMVIFPEGTRTQTGKIGRFKKGISMFSERTNTPILFLFLEGAYDLWPKGAGFAHPGKLIVHVGPVHPPAAIDQIYDSYKKWIESIHPGLFEEDLPKDGPAKEVTPPTGELQVDLIQEGLDLSDKAETEPEVDPEAESDPQEFS